MTGSIVNGFELINNLKRSVVLIAVHATIDTIQRSIDCMSVPSQEHISASHSHLCETLRQHSSNRQNDEVSE